MCTKLKKQCPDFLFLEMVFKQSMFLEINATLKQSMRNVGWKESALSLFGAIGSILKKKCLLTVCQHLELICTLVNYGKESLLASLFM